MTPDQVCKEFSKEAKTINLNLSIIDTDMIVLRGTRKSLEFIAKLILAQAEQHGDDGFQISPKGAGKTFFQKKSQFGIYIKCDK